jgi:hypothetical protein
VGWVGCLSVSAGRADHLLILVRVSAVNMPIPELQGRADRLLDESVSTLSLEGPQTYNRYFVAVVESKRIFDVIIDISSMFPSSISSHELTDNSSVSK